MEHSEPFYCEPRFEMSLAGRVFVRFFSYGGFAILAAGGLLLGLSEARPLRAIGLLFLVFFIDHCFHLNRPEKPLALVVSGNRNISECLSPRAYRALETALDRTAFEGSDFALNLAGELLRCRSSKAVIGARGITADDFLARIDDRRKPLQAQDKEQMLIFIDRLVRRAFKEALVREAVMVSRRDLFSAVLVLEPEEIARIFEVFGLKKV